MARRPSKHLRPPRPLVAGGFARAERKRDGEWLVQAMAADRSGKEYICPGCRRTIPPGTPHVVTWPRTPPVGLSTGVEARRHWHTSCWGRRT